MTNKINVATRAGALAFAELCQKKAREEFDDSGEVMQKAIVLASKNERGETFLDDEGGPTLAAVCVLALDLPEAPEQKDAFAAFIASVIQATEAIGVVIVSEAWSAIPGPGLKRSEIPASLQEPFPGRREIIMISMEHVTFERTLLWSAEITRDANGKGTVGAFEAFGNHPSEYATGRFVHLLRREAPQRTTTEGTAHVNRQSN